MTLNWQGVDEIDRLVGKENYVLGYAGGGGTILGQHHLEQLYPYVAAWIVFLLIKNLSI